MDAPARNFLSWLETTSHPNEGWQHGSRASRVPSVLSTGELKVVFQPLVDLRTVKPFAYEALVRSSSPEYKGPPALFDEAISSNCCGALGRAVRELAVQGCPGFPLFLNLHPNEFNEGWLVQPNDPIFRHEHGVYLEITESVPLSHFQQCHSVLREVRHKGVLLAVDDLGAGYSNLKYIADLAPEVVKLDRGLVADIAHHPRQRRLVAAIAGMCTELGARVVAEGIETKEEAQIVCEIGVHYGQGYYFARPDFPPPEVPQDRL